jgi:hypothetical protein
MDELYHKIASGKMLAGMNPTGKTICRTPAAHRLHGGEGFYLTG